MKRAAVLRWSLLASLGLLPVACGKVDDDDDSGGSAGKGGSGGVAGAGGSAGKGGSGGTAGKGGSGGSGGTAIGKPPTCTDPTKDGMGLTRCKEGYRYRAEPQTCDYRADEGPGSGGAGGSDQAGRGGAGQALDCGECGGEHEFCRVVSGTPFTSCSLGCLNDDECGQNSFCVCDSNRGGFCSPAMCREDADCDDGYHCAEIEAYCTVDVAEFACQTPEDECLTSADCDGATCAVEVEPGDPLKRTCEVAVCGRPFLVEAAVRVAPVTSRDDWTARSLAPRVDHLTAAERAAEAAHWTLLGQMEHASIAAFARFQLQLLALGAPPELVQACNQALVDETAHTRLCFALASAYAGRGIGPSALDVSHSLDVTSLADIVDLVIAEGCFGETSAALEALESADAATDPVIRDAYTRIAEDEQRHAELAFQFVRWALERGGSEVRERIAEAIEVPRSESAGSRAVTVPCLKALLGAERVAIAEPASCANCATA